MTVKDASGHTASSWTDANSREKYVDAHQHPVQQIFRHRLEYGNGNRLGEWNSGDYYIDDAYFAQNASDLLTGFVTPTYPVVFQDFENGNGFAAASGATAALDSDSANTAEAKSVRLVTTKIKRTCCNPENGASLSVTAYTYLNFFVKDTGGSNNLNVSIQMLQELLERLDKRNMVKNQWTKISLPLNQVNGIDLSVVVQNHTRRVLAGNIYFDDVYFSQKAAENVSGFQNQPANVSADWYQNFEYGRIFRSSRRDSGD